MAGIYIHIPFCKQACHYCDFHFSTNLSLQESMTDAICEEIIQRKTYLDSTIHTIYYGGGTPSLLSEKQLAKIQQVIYDNFSVNPKAEITLEANPEDLTPQKLVAFANLGINRLSIGLQALDGDTLHWMNRSHSLAQGITAYENARNAGFNNISIDLMYAVPILTEKKWKKGIQQTISLNPEHISIYGLTIEDRTVFGKKQEKNELIQMPEEQSAQQYLHLIRLLSENGYNQYEVSNFSKNGFESKHNGQYWRGVHYLGVGPGAHSYDGKSRQYNIQNNPKYIKLVNAQQTHYELELLTQEQHINEQILTSLRTKDGLFLDNLQEKYQIDLYEAHQKMLTSLADEDMIQLSEKCIQLLPKGFLVADEIALKLFV